MPKRLLLVVVVVMLVIGGAVVVVAQEGEDAVQGDPAAGAGLYAEYCAACHGPQGESRAVHEAFAATMSYDTRFVEIVALGVETSDYMPAWHEDEGGPLTEAQIIDLAAYVQSWTSGEPTDFQIRLNIADDLTDAELLGATLFFENCAGCHGLEGEGRGLKQFPAIDPHIDVEAIARRGLVDAGMPPFAQAYGGPLDEAQIDSIMLYVASWDRPTDLQQVVDSNPKGIHQGLWLAGLLALVAIGFATLNSLPQESK